MNEIRVYISCSEQPVDEGIALIECTLRDFLNSFGPDVEIARVQSGRGSWWMDVVGTIPPVASWLSVGFAGWLLGKALDKGGDHVVKRIQAAKGYSDEDAFAKVEDTNVSQKNLDDFLDAQDMREKILSMNEIRKDLGARKLRVSGWSEDVAQGRSIEVIGADGDDFDIHMYQINSKQDYDNLLQ